MLLTVFEARGKQFLQAFFAMSTSGVLSVSCSRQNFNLHFAYLLYSLCGGALYPFRNRRSHFLARAEEAWNL